MLSALKLSQFRCFDSLRLDLGPGMTAFIGNNAQGKTSILEAVCVLLRLHSPRTNALNEMIQFGGSGFGLAGTWDDSELQLVNEARRCRQLLYGGSEVTRVRDYLEQSGLVVWMGNDDLALVTGVAGKRRRYLDFQAAQLSVDYLAALRSYERALRARNELLRSQGSQPPWSQIDAYTAVMADHGSEVVSHRRQLVEWLDQAVGEAQRNIAGPGHERLSLRYEPSGEGDLLGVWDDSRDRDSQRGVTTLGPHRDDLAIEIDGRPAGRYASEGQQRTIALALKLGQLELLRAQTQRHPILLVDDVFGELDPQRREALTRAFPEESQKLITTTSLDWLPQMADRAISVFRVDAGSVTPGT